MKSTKESKKQTNFEQQQQQQQDLFDGKYSLQGSIGSGGASNVYRAEDGDGVTVAVKLLDKVENDEDELEMFEAERIYLNKVKGTKGVIQIVDHGEALFNGKMTKYIVTEYVEGVTLFDYVQKGGRIPVPQAKYFFCSLFKTVTTMHNKGVVHRDIKLENILVRQNGDLLLIDFGFAAPLSGNNGRGYFENEVCGTKNYMAPELLKGILYRGSEVDIFAMGVVLFTMVFGRSPFRSAVETDPFYMMIACNHSEVFWKRHLKGIPEGEERDSITEDLKGLIISMLQLLPNHRPSTSEILGNPWLREAAMDSQEEIKAEYERRFKDDSQQDQQEQLETAETSDVLAEPKAKRQRVEQ